MKKTHIIAILAIAVCLAFVLGSLFDSSSYADFDEAFANPDREFHVVGELDRSQAVVYNPQEDHSLTKFTLIDEKGVAMPVNLHRSKPADFDKSDKIVLIGKAGEGSFEAKDILLKCPSKYEDEKGVQTAEVNN